MLSIYSTKRVNHPCLLYLFLTSFFCQAFLLFSEAQITLDGSLGPRGPLSGPNYEISTEMGQLRGRNLFHSFGQLNVLTGESATFTGPASVDHIISRVTGGSLSVIDGLLQSNIPGASLFILNPSGVLFGPNTQLHVSGSFHVSTANVIHFSDGATFSANLAENSSLTVAPPFAFGFLNNNPAGITIQGSRLEVNQGATLSVTGGNITMLASQEPMIQSPSLEAPSGRIYLTSVASAGDVQVESVDNTSRLINNRPIRLGSVLITDGARVLASGERGGTILVEADTVTLANQAAIRNSTSGAGQSGDILIKTDDLALSMGSEISSSTDPGSSGNAGNVRVEVRTVAIRDGSKISNFTLGDGRGGNVTLLADTLTMDGFDSQIVAATQGGTGDAGNVRVEARTVTVTKGALIGNGTFGIGRGGDITILAQDAVTVNGFGVGTPEGQEVVLPSLITTSTQPGSTGNAGNVRVEAQSVTVTNGAQIQSGTAGQGRGGDVTILAQDAVTVNGFGGGVLSLITASSLLGPTGDAGNVRVEAQTVTATNGAQISSGSFGTGHGGSVTVIARDSVTFRGTSPQGEKLLGVLFPDESTFASGASVASVSSGAPGIVQVTAPRVILAEGGQISGLNIASQGTGGTTIVHASDTLAISGAGSGIRTASLGPGAGGDIIVNVGTISLTEGADLSAASTPRDDAQSSGNAGNITVTASKSLLIQNSSVTTEATQAKGGDITLRVQDMIRLRDSQITAEVGSGEGAGGNITIDPAVEFVVLEGSQVTANAVAGPGGNITIRAGVFLTDPSSSITASSISNIPGEIDIQASITNLSGLVTPLPPDFATVGALLHDPCVARLHAGTVSSFVVRGRASLLTTYDGPLPSRLYESPQPRTPPTGAGHPPRETTASSQVPLGSAGTRSPLRLDLPCASP